MSSWIERPLLLTLRRRGRCFQQLRLGVTHSGRTHVPYMVRGIARSDHRECGRVMRGQLGCHHRGQSVSEPLKLSRCVRRGLLRFAHDAKLREPRVVVDVALQHHNFFLIATECVSRLQRRARATGRSDHRQHSSGRRAAFSGSQSNVRKRAIAYSSAAARTKPGLMSRSQQTAHIMSAPRAT